MTGAGPSTTALESIPGRLRMAGAARAIVALPLDPWRYGASIAFEGLIAASEILADKRYAFWAYGALRGWAARAPEIGDRHDVAPGSAACRLAEQMDDDSLVELVARLADRLIARRQILGAYVSYERSPLREPYGGDTLPPDEQALLADPGAGVFLNPLHFSAAFLARYGRLVGDPRYVDAALGDLAAHLEILQADDGLVGHFMLERTGLVYGRGWGRGQAWALLGIYDALRSVSPDDPRREAVAERARRLAHALASLQDVSGGWRMVVDDPASPLEPSAAAFAAAAFADGVELGLLPPLFGVFAERAWNAALAHVDEDGVLRDVSVNVGACTQISHYARCPTGAPVAWGQGPILRAAASLERVR